jgi:dienelactone hydrolase
LTETLTPMNFSDDVVAKGVRERRFDLGRDGGVVPGLLWTPAEADGPAPVVLLGHGAAGNKREDYIVALARGLVRHHGLAAVAIDGPVHGDRRTDGSRNGERALVDFAQRWSSDEGLLDSMVADWRAVLDALARIDEVASGRCAYWGLSMGTIFGLPLVAAEDRVSAAVLGLMGLTGPTRERFAVDAELVKCPVLFLVQWHDELFPRDKALELFDAIGSTDKRLHAHPGLHGEVPAEEFEASGRFLASYLTA